MLSRSLPVSALLLAALVACDGGSVTIDDDADTDTDTEADTDTDDAPFEDPCVSLSLTPEAGVTVPRFDGQDLAGVDFTVEAWVVVNDVDPSHTVAFSDPQSDLSGWRLVVLGEPGARALRFQLGGGGPAGPTAQSPAGSVPENRWVHLAITYEQVSGTVSMYVDGDRKGTPTLSGRPKSGESSGPLVLGGTRPDGPAWMNGFLDEVRISDTIRYAGSFTPAVRHEVDDDTIGLWHLDAGEGRVATDATGANDGAIDGATWSTTSACDTLED